MNYNHTEGFQVRAAVIVVALLFLFSLISLTATLQKSLTFDEPLHIYAGYSYLRWRDFRVNPEHPPLAKVLAALPLIACELDTTSITRAQRDFVQQRKDYGWILANHLFMSNDDRESLFFYAKLVMIGLAAALGIFVFLWARALYGLTAGIVALAVYSFDPNILAHSSIVHTDMPFALCFFAGTYFFWRTSNRFNWINLLCTAFFFALSSVTKFTFIVILPVWAVLGLIRVFSSEPQQSQITSPDLVDRAASKLVLLTLVLATAVIMAYVVIWAAYGFRFDAVGHQKGQMLVDRLLSKESWLSPLLVLNSQYFVLPEAWVYGLLDMFKDLDRSSYLFGEISNDGSWLYFPIAFTVKTPLPTLLLICAALGLLLFRRGAQKGDIFLLLPVFIFFSVAVWSRLNIGVRHILPIYPFLFVWLGGTVKTIWLRENHATKFSTLFIGIWLLASCLKTYPDYLAFFNELAGGPENGRRVLVDSNLDWGQDLKGLKLWMDNHNLKKIELAYFGTIDPSYYGINAVPAPGSITPFWRGGKDNLPTSSYIAISATYLEGLYLGDKDTYAVFRGKTPIASIGHSILVFPRDQ
jgi:type IV secretory pathway TrbD component